MTTLARRCWAAALASVLLFVPLLLGAATDEAKEASGSEAAETPPIPFDVTYDVGLVPSEKSAHVAIELGAGADAVRWIRFDFDPLRHRAIEADGKLERDDKGRMIWTPPTDGGTLRYVFAIDHLRNEGAYDARCAKNWALFRGQDIVPKMRIRTAAGALSNSILQLRTPEGWSAAVPYRSLRGGRYDLANPRTRFDRPTGWLAFGKLGVIREEVEGMRVSIVGPAGKGIRRMDTLAMLRWTAPALADLFGELPERFQIVIAGDPMWRGGLSAPRSIYLHVDRPLIGNDGTSPLLHELVHSFMHARSGKGGRWISEGIAEYYSIALLRRSETLSAKRYEDALENLRGRAAPVDASFEGRMTSALRARAVVRLLEVDEFVRDATGGSRNLDDVVRALTSADEALTFKGLRAAIREVSGLAYPETFESPTSDS